MLNRKQREQIEKKGVPYSIAAIINTFDDIDIDCIELITDKHLQWKGIDYTVTDKATATANIDTKFHMRTNRYQKLSEYGVNLLSIEVTKRNGKAGWGLNKTLKTDYIIDIIKGVGYYVIDAKQLHEFMTANYTNYSTIYSNEGHEDYRGVSVDDLIESNVILAYYS